MKEKKTTEIRNRLNDVLALAEIVSRVSANDEKNERDDVYDARIVSIYPNGMDYDDEDTQVFTIRLHMPEKKVEIIVRKEKKASLYEMKEETDIVDFLCGAIDAVLKTFKHIENLDSDDLTFKWLDD